MFGGWKKKEERKKKKHSGNLIWRMANIYKFGENLI